MTSVLSSMSTKTTPNPTSKSTICKAVTSKSLAGLLLASSAFIVSGCQTTQQMGNPANTSSVMMDGSQSQYPQLLQSFNIRGKIGVTTPETATSAAQTGSAFYVWAQEEDRFAIDITGALGIGHTVIEYNGSSATLVSERTGEITAASPEQLLQQATGWQAPISQLRYWISGRPAPSDIDSQLDEQGRLLASRNGDWQATFDYKNDEASSRLPTKIKVARADGHKVIMTISHSR